MKTILVPVDFSKSSMNALEYACCLAQQNHSNIVLLNCYQIPAGQGTVMIDFKDILEKDSITGLNKALVQIQKSPASIGLDFKVESFYGFLLEGVTTLCKKYAVDLIVMGTTGASNMTSRIFGSNTSNLLRRIKTPILAVPETASWTDWRNTVIATDFVENKSNDVFTNLKKVTNGMELNLDILHVIHKAGPQKDFSKAESKFLAAIGNTKAEFHYEPAESVTEGILNYLSNHACDVLVMLRRKHGFLEQLFNASSTRKMALHAKNPILVLQQ